MEEDIVARGVGGEKGAMFCVQTGPVSVDVTDVHCQKV